MSRMLLLNCAMPRPRTRASRRSGLTLMEVLIAMAVILIGLLGVMAMIPIAYRAIAEAEKTDRVTNCGNWALAEVELYDMLDAACWFNADGTSFDTTQTGCELFVIDPLFVARNGTAAGQFPVSAPTETPAVSMPRYSLSLPGGSEAMSWGSAARLFISGDLLNFERPDDGSLRPNAFFRDSSWSTTTDISVAVAPTVNESYSWMFTVAPSPTEAALAFSAKTVFDVSVVVFRGRNYTPASEAVAAISGFVFASGTGEVQLTPGDFEIEDNQWILIRGKENTAATPHCIYRWYQVVAAIEPDTLSGTNTWSLSIEGPDWDANYSATYAIIVPGVFGVYTLP